MKRNSILVLIAILLLTILNWEFPFLRFTNHFANHLFSLLVTLIPFILCLTGIIKLNDLKSKRVSIIGTLVLTPFCLLFLMFFSILAMSLPPLQNESNSSFEKLYQVNDEVAVYRTNGGATTAYGIEVRQEKPVIPGIIAVKKLFYRYRMYDILYTVAGNQLTLRDTQSNKILEEIEIKSYLYF